MTHHDADFDSDLDALAGQSRGRPGPPCGVAESVERIRGEHPHRADQVVRAINDEGVPANAVAEFLTKHSGRTIKAAVVRYHRRRGTVNGCSCP